MSQTITSPENEALYRCLKRMENTAQGMIFEIPGEGSAAFKALDLQSHEAWKLGCLAAVTIWYRNKCASAANRVFAETKSEPPRGIG